MRGKALHILSIILLTFRSVIMMEAQTFPEGADQPKSKIKILGDVYGGGDQAAVQGNTNVTINKGQFAGDIFGGGNGALNADGTVNASADIGTHNDDGTLTQNTGTTSVTINGGEIIFVNEHPSKHNIYGGGNKACNIAGSTDVKINTGMVSWYTFLSNQDAVIPQWYDWYDQAMMPNLPKSPICAVFGAGYGKNTDVAGNTNVLVNIKGTTDMSLPEGDGIYAKLEEIDQIIMRWMPDHRLVGQFVTGAFGGGYDGTVGAYDVATQNIKYDKDNYTSQTSVTIKGNPFLYNVFGGGLGSEDGAAGDYMSHVGAIYGGTNVDIQGGVINGSVFGGGAGIRGEVSITTPIEAKMPYVWAGQVYRETEVKISGNKTVVFGNVYGGGDIANTGWYSANARPKESHQANENHYKAKLDYTTSLHLNGGHILGKVFGGGNGRPVTEIEQYKFVGAVFGNTNVAVDGSTIWNDIYGGGKTGSVFSCKYIADTNHASYRDVAGRKDGCTNVDIFSGKVAQDIFGGGWGDETEVEGVLKVSSADVTNNTYVFFEDGKLEWSKYWKSREIADAEHMGSWTNPEGEITGRFEDQKTVIVDGLYQDAESDINHNLYGGGNVACVIGGNAHIHMTSAPQVPASFASSGYYQQCVANVGKPHFSSFGGGFGVNAIVKGNTYCDIRLKAGSAFYSVIGGGMNGPVDGTCLVHVGADPNSVIHSVYGGGYYANCGGTDLHLTSGFIRTDVFGGSVMGNVGVSPLTQYATRTTIGLSEADPSLIIKTEDNIDLDAINLATTQNKIIIGGNVYGANDVAGRVYGKSDYTDAKITDFDGNLLKDASNNDILALGSANLNIYGGTINGDVFGAGNGDHIGYYEPNLCEYYYGKNEGNYYLVDHTDTEGPKGNTYTSRPQTESVKLTIAGNEDQRVTILGQVFGGGNSCTIGNWDVNMLAAEGKYHGDPHLTRDDPDYFLGGGKLEVNLGSHIHIGRTHKDLAESADGSKYLIDVDGQLENVSGLYMGCSGRNLATQNSSTSKTDNLYHHYYDTTSKQYWPGFAVYQENTNTLLSRQEGLQSFLAYMNNILVWSDDVTLNIKNLDGTDADDIWISNFVGGGFRGSMKALTENGQFHYTLPRGVTIGHDVIGGAFNTDVVYRIFETSDGHTYSEENGHYKYLTNVGTLTQADESNTTGDYHHIEYAADGITPTGIVRFYYDGGMLSELPYGTSKISNDRINRILKKYSAALDMPVDRDVNKDFTGTGLTDNKAFNYYKRDALVYLELDNRLQVEYVDGHVHGGNVFGGCFSSGRVEGDIWTDYRCYQESQQSNSEDFNLSDRSFNNAKNFEDNFAMMLFGAGYGANTNIQGSAYVRVLHPEKNPSAPIPDMAYGYPRLYNVFGGSYEGKVEGNTNIYFNPGKYGYVTGAIYGGGCNGYVGGKTYLELAGGYIDEAYGGARNANIGGGTHIWAYDGQTRWWGEDVIHSNGDPMAETDAEKAPLFIGKLYGGTDISGQICTDEAGNYDAEKGYQPYYSAEYWPKELTTTGTYDSDHPGDNLTFIDTYLQVGGVGQSDSGFPIIGAVYAAGNGENTKSFFDAKYALTNRIEDQYSDARLPHQHSTLMEVSDGNIVYAFGGGNRATVTDQNYIMVRSELGGKHDIEDLGVQMYDVMKKRVLSVGVDCYDEKLDENNKKVLDLKNASIQRLFGGNNIATMDIQPKWQLISGRINNVYSGGNMGDMTYYNPEGKPATETGSIGGTAGAIAADGSNSNYTPRGLSITIEHPEIHIGSLYGGCRLSDVNPTPKVDQPAWPTGTDGEDFYGATVNITDGYIENVYGGNDISGTVHHGTNVNISGAVSGNVYGSGNGFYLYKWDENATQITEHLLKEYDSTLPDDDKSLCYTVPASDIHNGTSANNTEKLLTINDARPSVEKAFLNIAGLEHYPTSNAAAPKRVAYVKGNVFCGGNASTIIGDGSFSKFKIGSYVTLNGVFMGSDGYAFTQNDQIAAFAKLNGFTDMGEATVASSFLDWDGSKSIDHSHNPILLNVYMMAVDMKAHPKDFNLNLPLKEAHIGTYCGGGNRGSMLVDKMVSLPFHHDIIIYDKIVGACLDANIKYNQNGTIIRSDGGYSRAVDVEHNGEHGEYGNTKIRLDIASQFVPLKMDVPADKLEKTKNKHGENFAQAAAHDFLYDNRTEEVKYTYEEFNTLFETDYTSQVEFEAKESNDHIWKEAPTDAYAASCNIYGGCYESGEVEGDIIINLHSNMLRYVNEEILKKSVDYNIACFNVYGAGFGQDSHVWGNVNINMDRSLNTATMGDNIAESTLSTSLSDELTSVGAFDILDGYLNADLDNHNFNRSYPSANNIIGGGRNGKLIGNTTLEIRNGLVYTDVAGGCYASDMYGSTHVIVGYPKYYRCNKSGIYALDRADKWNTAKLDGDGNVVIKQNVSYLKGDLVPDNIYQQIVAKTPDNSSHFDLVTDMPSTSNGAKGWDDVHIKIGKGVYGGGYSLENSMAASAGSITTHKLKDDKIDLHPHNFNGRYGLDIASTVGYGGNSNIMVGDMDKTLAENSSYTERDHIHISTLNATEANIPAASSVIGKFVLEDGKYTHQGDHTPEDGVTYYTLTGDGGIYGDGHLTFCEGFRSADVTRYGWAEGTPKHPVLLNTFQRMDLLSVNDCCLMLQGAQDFATDQIDATVYSITRINELRMNSTLDASADLTPISPYTGAEEVEGFRTKQMRNYLAFFNNVHYLGSIVTNDPFDGRFHRKDGTIVNNTDSTYIATKQKFIDDYTSSTPDSEGNKTAESTNIFKQRNVATARNAIGINNGYCLRVLNQEYDFTGDVKVPKSYYGPIVGVCEVKLLTLVQGEGGGYVYADNIHKEYTAKDGHHNENDYFLMTSGNFVFPGIIQQGKDEHGNDIGDQFIVDDCFLEHFGTPGKITTKVRATGADLDEAHYWYVEGNKYFFTTTLTGFTYQKDLIFNLTKTDPNIILSGLGSGAQLNVKKIEWLSTEDNFHRDGYQAVLPTNATETDDGGNTIEKISDYEFDIEIGGYDTDDWKWDMPRHTDLEGTKGKTLQNNHLPQFNIKLQDKLDNSGDEAYNNHLDEPELVKIYLQGEYNGQIYEYTITVNIVYLQGPTVNGFVKINNCALPGEWIRFSTDGLVIKTPELMPVTSASWQILPLKQINSDGSMEWDMEHGIVIDPSRYGEITGTKDVEGTIRALYKQNEYNIAYIFTAGGYDFPVMPAQNIEMEKEERMIVVHNYHRMKDVVPQELQIETMPSVPDYRTEPASHHSLAEAKIYIEDEADLRAFVEYLNMATTDNTKNIPVGLTGLDFILQKDIKLTSDLPAITQSFAGNFHGDGYHIDLGEFGSTLFGDNLEGKVYNLGLVNGENIASTGSVVNSYVYDASDDNFKYGKMAYQLSHAFNPTTDASTYESYVATRYANGDYQYAADNRPWSLRTGAPNYGNDDTRHNTEHTHDEDRWDNTSETNVPLYDGTRVVNDVNKTVGVNVVTFKGLPVAYANDYLFFGQHLDKTSADAYPMHIEDVATGDADRSKGGNRVYETAGYHHSSDNDGFYYNKDAWALQPTLTAIDYTNMTVEGDGAVTLPATFNVDSNKDYDKDGNPIASSPYSNAVNGHVSQNLLVYNAGEAVFDQKEVDDIAENAVTYHNLVNNGSNFATDYFHLVDKQCFNAPIAFNVAKRAWYERMPERWRNVTGTESYDSPSAWEGICLPFTARKVSAVENGELSHFYGTGDQTETIDGNTYNINTLHHEYWLTGFTKMEGDATAVFSRPSVAGGGLFVNDKQTDEKIDYTYPVNDYFTSLLNYTDYHDKNFDESDEEGDEWIRSDAEWYLSSHEYEDYVPLTASVPYLIAFPGNDFYEFSLEGQTADDKKLGDGHKKSGDPQLVTFENKVLDSESPIQINVSDTEIAGNKSYVNDYYHVGTYMRVVSDDEKAYIYGVNSTGSAFTPESDTTPVLPFRTYMTRSENAPQTRSILISDGYITEIGEEVHPEDELGEDYLKIWGEGRDIVVETSKIRSFNLFGLNGAFLGKLECKPGVNRFTQEVEGIYLVGKTKVLLK